MRTFAKLLVILLSATSVSAFRAQDRNLGVGTGWASTTYLRQVTLERRIPQVRHDWARLVLPLELPDERGKPVSRNLDDAAFYEGTVLPELVKACLERNIVPIIHVRLMDCGALAASEIPNGDFESSQRNPAGKQASGRYISPYRFKSRLAYVKERLSSLGPEGKVQVVIDFMHPFRPLMSYSTTTREEVVRRIQFDPMDLPLVDVAELEKAFRGAHPKNREAFAEFLAERERSFVSMAEVVAEQLKPYSPATFEGATMLLASQVLRSGIGYSRRALTAKLGPLDCYVFISSADELRNFSEQGLASLRRELPPPCSILFVGPDPLAIDPASVPLGLRESICIVSEP